MGTTTGISWTDHTWNPWRGCTRVSAGCEHCYALAEQARFQLQPEILTRTKTWGTVLRWNAEAKAAGRRALVFTCSWSDFFHEQADAWREEAWELIWRCDWLVFQILTKRIDRLGLDHRLLPATWGYGWDNVWMGATAENQAMAEARIPILRDVPAVVRFVSCEPLLEEIPLRETLAPRTGNPVLGRIDQVIFGGESGPRARPCRVNWIRRGLRDCRAVGAAVWVKQLGSRPEASTAVAETFQWPAGTRWGETGPRLCRAKGEDPNEWPADLRVQEYPVALGRTKETA